MIATSSWPRLLKVKTFSPDVTYSGQKYIGIQSAKYLISSTNNHLADMKRIRELGEFDRSVKNSNDEEIPVMLVSVDGVAVWKSQTRKINLMWSWLF